ncbi:MAG: hypothetical protein B7733_19345 [Myxococcales bacterium FL481]|nr:MAG: hypothetical protein B7733_19345 [Myxococcales bacterium FL481]
MPGPDPAPGPGATVVGASTEVGPAPDEDGATPGEARSPPAAPPVVSSEAQLAEDLARRAWSIEALLAGHLGPEIDTGALLDLDLTRSDLDAAALLERLAQPPRARRRVRRWRPARRAPAALSSPANLAEARIRLVDAVSHWLLVPEAHRAAALQYQAERVAASQREQVVRGGLLTRWRALTTGTEQLRALLEGRLEPAAEPEPLLRLDLADPHELLRSIERRRRLDSTHAGGATAPRPAAAAPPEPAGAGVAEEPTADAVAAMTVEGLQAAVKRAEAAFDVQRGRLLRLTSDQRAQLVADHHARRRQLASEEAAVKAAEIQRAAEEQALAQGRANAAAKRIEEAQDAAAVAAARREAALEAARQAKSEARRIVAEDQARLLGVREAQALFEAALTERRTETTRVHDAALERSRRAEELVTDARTDGRSAEDADASYVDLRRELTTAREQLGRALRSIATGRSEAPAVGDTPADPGGDVDRQELLALYDRVTEENRRLRELERDLAWDQAASHRDDVVLLNTARLAVLEVTSARLRSDVTGFGAAGVEQVARELEQIALELRYQALSLPRYGRRLLRDFETAPVPVAWGLIQVLLAVVLLRWWRRRANGLFSVGQRRLLTGRRRSRLARIAASWLWYIDRVRKPLELLAVLWFIANTVQGLVDHDQLELLWLTASWLLVGSAIVLWIDAVATRDALRYTHVARERANLRFRSLRLVGLNVVLVGLLLSTAEVLVGRGAIYRWVITTCWVLAIPVTVVLVGWWRKHVFAALEAEKSDKFAHWVLRFDAGASGFAMAALGGAYLVARGVGRWIMQRLSGLEVTRRLMAYLFRREVAKQAVATGGADRLQPLDGELRERLLESSSRDILPPTLNKAIDQVMAVTATTGTTIVAIVGERGMGKTSVLRRLAERSTVAAVRVECPAGGYPQLVGALTEALSAPRRDEASLISTLSAGEPTVVCLDDVQRLVRPVIGGLRGIDALGELARQAGPHVSWVFSMGAPAWQYVQRARGDRLFFDHVCRLRPWSEEDIAALLRQRSRIAGIEPSFEGLVVPRRYDAQAAAPDLDRGEQGFYRILWDYADGNPRVACLFWAESLCRVHPAAGTDGGPVRAVVRLFKEPSAAELDALAMPIRFVLRSLIQLEVATVADLIEAARLTPAEAADAIRYTVAHGYVECRDNVYAVSWPWYRAVTNMLRRQHLLAS